MKSENTTPSPKRSWLPWVRSCFLLICVVFFVVYLVSQKNTLTSYEWRISPFLLSVFLIASLASNLFALVPWWLTMRAFDRSVSFGRSSYIVVLSIPARYVPGKIGNIVGKFMFAKTVGIGVETAGSAIAIDSFFLTLSSAVTALIFFGFSLRKYLFSIIGCATVAAVVIALPLVLQVTKKIIGRIFKRQMMVSGLSRRSALWIFFCNILNWVTYGMAFWLWAQCTFDKPCTLDQAIWVMATGWIAGFSALFVPNGFGVTEGVAGFLLRNSAPLPVLVALVLVFRLLYQATEMLVFIAGWIIFKKYSFPKV